MERCRAVRHTPLAMLALCHADTPANAVRTMGASPLITTLCPAHQALLELEESSSGVSKARMVARATVANNYAFHRRSVGSHEEALEFYMEAWELREAVLGSRGWISLQFSPRRPPQVGTRTMADSQRTPS